MNDDQTLAVAETPDASSHGEKSLATTTDAPAHRMVRKLVSGLGEGGLLLLLTCLSYSLAYCYKLGQYRAFNLPSLLVSIDLNDCLRAGGAVLSGVFTMFLFLNAPFAVSNFITFKRVGWKYMCVSAVILFSIFTVLNALFEVSLTSFLIGLAITAGVVLLISGVAAILIKLNSKRQSDKREYNDLYDWLRQALGREMFFVVLLLPLIGLFVEKLGYSNSRKQKDFFQISDTHLILIDSTSVGLICKTLDADKATLTKGFTILSGGELEKVIFESRSLTAWNQDMEPPVSKGSESEPPPKEHAKEKLEADNEPDSTVPTTDATKEGGSNHPAPAAATSTSPSKQPEEIKGQ